MQTPYVIGVAGGSGSGKTTVAYQLARSVAPEYVTMIEHDAYYRDLSRLSKEARDAVNFDHPDALETDLLIEHLARLREGKLAEIPEYDFATHTRKKVTKRALPTKIVIVEGILVFVEERLRQLFDLKLFVDTDADIRAFRRIRRDIEQRGRTFQSVREQYYNSVRPMHLQFVEPSKRWADLIIPEGGENQVAIELIITKLQRIIEKG